MGGGSTTTNQNTSSQSINEIPQWVQNAGQANYGLAQRVASQPLQQYQGQMVADVSPQQQQAFNLAANSGNVGQSAQNAAQAGYLNTLAQTPQQVTTTPVTAGQLSNTNLQPYMNPYTQDVINRTLPIMQQNLALSQDQNQDQAAASNAYGGSRQAIQQGVTQAQGALGMGQMAAQLNQANYSQAQQAAMQDIANRLQAGEFSAGQNLTGQQLNQAAGLTQEQLANQAAQGLGTLGNQQMYNNLANYGMLTNAGGLEQQQQQNDINAQMAKFQQAFTYPQQQLGIMESALGMTPYNTGTSGSSASTQTTTQSNPLASALSGAQALGSFASLIPGFSDRRMKTDIKKVGKHPTGVGIYSYRYKGDPKTYPKVVGPMAEDVQKIAPHAVAEIPGSGGKKAVHMPTLNALSTPPSSPGVAKAIGMMQPGTPGVLSAAATPPTRGMLPRNQKRVPGTPIVGALGG